jgi:hypothetical protein
MLPCGLLMMARAMAPPRSRWPPALSACAASAASARALPPRSPRAALECLQPHDDAVAVLFDADLEDSAARLVALVLEVRSGRADVAVAAFSRRLGGGLGVVVGFARWAIARRCGLHLRAPISGQRALRVRTLKQVMPFAADFGMEIGMTIDAARAGYRVGEVEVDLSHRASGRTLAGSPIVAAKS